MNVMDWLLDGLTNSLVDWLFDWYWCQNIRVNVDLSMCCTENALTWAFCVVAYESRFDHTSRDCRDPYLVSETSDRSRVQSRNPRLVGGKKIQNKTKTSRSSSTLQSWWLWLDCLKKRRQWSFPGCCPFAAFFVRGFRGSEPKHHHYVFGLFVFLLSLLLVRGRTVRSLEGMSPGPSTTTESADCVTWFRLWRDV